MSSIKAAGLLAALMLWGLAAPRLAVAQCAASEGDFDKNGSTDLKLVGTSTKQNVLVQVKNTGYVAKIDCNGNGSYADGADVNKTGTKAIESVVTALGGGDVITVELAEDLVGSPKHVSAPLTAGANKFTFDAKGFDLRAGSSLVLDVRGTAANDNVTISFAGAGIEDSLVIARVDAAEGNDVVKWIGAARTVDSVVDTNLVLGAGGNNAAVNDAGGLVSRSVVNMHVVGGGSTTAVDTLTTTWSGSTRDNSRVYLNSTMSAGNDRVTLNFDVSSFAIDPAGWTGSELWMTHKGGIDTDTIKVSDLAAGGSATINGLLALDLEAGNQYDAVGIVWHGLDGNGQFRYRADGESGSDNMNMTFKASPTAANDLWFLIQGGPEEDITPLKADAVTVSFDENGSNVSYGPLGEVLLDGGLDVADTCTFTGNGPRTAINCEQGSW